MLYMICVVVFSIIMGCVVFWGTDCESYWARRRLTKCFSEIDWYQTKEEKDSLTFIYKGKEFIVRVEYGDNNKYYKSANFYINDECVVTLHSLVGTFRTVRLAEYTFNRHNYEVMKILKAAQRVAKKKYNERISKKVNEEYNNKSYFK